jgi:hypothetical protein
MGGAIGGGVIWRDGLGGPAAAAASGCWGGRVCGEGGYLREQQGEGQLCSWGWRVWRVKGQTFSYILLPCLFQNYIQL